MHLKSAQQIYEATSQHMSICAGPLVSSSLLVYYMAASSVKINGLSEFLSLFSESALTFTVHKLTKIRWAWPLPIMFVVFFAPESPYFLVRKDRIEEARKMLQRLGSNKTDEEINSQLAMIVHTTKIESTLHEGTSYWDCFRGTDLRRTEIACVTFMGQVLSGSSFAYR